MIFLFKVFYGTMRIRGLCDSDLTADAFHWTVFRDFPVYISVLWHWDIEIGAEIIGQLKYILIWFYRRLVFDSYNTNNSFT